MERVLAIHREVKDSALVEEYIEGREFFVGVLGNSDPTAFPPGHLAEHQLTGNPVLVFFKPEGTELVVYHLEDAP